MTHQARIWERNASVSDVSSRLHAYEIVQKDMADLMVDLPTNCPKSHARWIGIPFTLEY